MRNWAEYGDDECTHHGFPTGGSISLQRVAGIYGWNVDRGETFRAYVEHIGATGLSTGQGNDILVLTAFFDRGARKP